MATSARSFPVRHGLPPPAAPRLAVEASRGGCRSADARSLTAQRSWKISSARLRVLQKMIEVLVRRDLLHHLLRRHSGPNGPVHGTRPSRQQYVYVGIGAGIALDQHDLASMIAVARQPAAIERRDRRRWRRARRGASSGASRCSRAMRQAPAGRRAWTARRRGPRRSRSVLSPSKSNRGRIGVGEQQRSAIRVWSAASRGGLIRWRALLDRTKYHRCASRRGSPSPISSIGVKQIALDIDRERLQRRDVERVQAFGRTLFDQLDEAGQEAGERLARAGGCYEQRCSFRPARGVQHRQLVAARPSMRLAGEPLVEQGRW